jgi:hypothetical protein
MVSNSFGHPSESETYTQKKKQILDEMEQFSELISTREGRVSPIQEETRQMQTERIV